MTDHSPRRDRVSSLITALLSVALIAAFINIAHLVSYLFTASA